MFSDEDISWLNFIENQKTCLKYFNKTSRVIQKMTNPHLQFFSLVFFLDKKSRKTILRDLFSRNNIRRRHRNGLINLKLNFFTISADHPLLFADSDSQIFVFRRINTNVSRKKYTISVDWKIPSDISIKHFLYARLVFFFSDVICIFADDVEGLEAMASYIFQWITIGNVFFLSRNIRSRIMIVQIKDNVAVTQSFLEFKELQFRLNIKNNERRNDVFSSIILFRLQKAHLFLFARHHRLKDVLLKKIDTARLVRFQEKVLFSAIHFEVFFRQTIHHIVRSITHPFDFIEKSRIHNEIKLNHQNHFFQFFRLGYENHISFEALTFIIIFSLLMNAYFFRMHSIIIFFN